MVEQTFQKPGDILQLWNVCFTVTTILFQKGENVAMFTACVCFEKRLKFSEDYAPCFYLLCCIVDVWKFFTTLNVSSGQTNRLVTLYRLTAYRYVLDW